MITALLTGIAASPLAQAALRYGTIALAIVLFLLSIRRGGERVGRLAERFETTENIRAADPRENDRAVSPARIRSATGSGLGTKAGGIERERRTGFSGRAGGVS
jgi:hypothetical protein